MLMDRAGERERKGSVNGVPAERIGRKVQRPNY